MIAKCVMFASNRTDCIQKAQEFLDQTIIEGIKTNIPFLKNVLQSTNFQNGDYTTNLVNEMKVNN